MLLAGVTSLASTYFEKEGFWRTSRNTCQGTWPFRKTCISRLSTGRLVDLLRDNPATERCRSSVVMGGARHVVTEVPGRSLATATKQAKECSVDLVVGWCNQSPFGLYWIAI